MSRIASNSESSSSRTKLYLGAGLVVAAGAALVLRGQMNSKADTKQAVSSGAPAAAALAGAAQDKAEDFAAFEKKRLAMTPEERLARGREAREILSDAADEYFGDNEPQMRLKNGKKAPVPNKNIARDLKIKHFKEALLRKELKKRPVLYNQAQQELRNRKPTSVSIEWKIGEDFSAHDVLVYDTSGCGLDKLGEKAALDLEQFKALPCLYQGPQSETFDKAVGKILLEIEPIREDSPRWKRLSRDLMREKVASEFVAAATKPS